MATRTQVVLALSTALAASTALYALQAGAQSPPPGAPDGATAPVQPTPPPATPQPPAQGGSQDTTSTPKQQERTATQDEKTDARARNRFTAEDRAAFFDARLAGLRAGLKLSDDQQRMWPAVETALRDFAAFRRDEAARRSERARPENRFAALRAMAEASSRRGAVLMRLADAVEPFQASLSTEQRRRLPTLLPAAYIGLFESHWEHRFDRPAMRSERQHRQRRDDHAGRGERGHFGAHWRDERDARDRRWKDDDEPRSDRRSRMEDRDDRWRKNAMQRDWEDGYRRLDDEEQPQPRRSRAYFDEEDDDR